MILDLRIDDEGCPDELPLPRIKDRGREHDVDVGLLSFACARNHQGAALRLGRLVKFDVLEVVREPCLDLLDPDFFVRYSIEASEHRISPHSVLGDAGDVVVMRPLLTHASGRSDPETRLHRRVLHLEFAADPDLTDGYEWYRFLPAFAKEEREQKGKFIDSTN